MRINLNSSSVKTPIKPVTLLTVDRLMVDLCQDAVQRIDSSNLLTSPHNATPSITRSNEMTTPRIDPDVKAEWTSALRSGKFKQGRDRLRTTVVASDSKFCCLGVLCEVTPAVDWNDGQYSYGNIASLHILPWSFADVIGMDATGHIQIEEIPATLDSGESMFQINLAGLNDRGFTFNQIADIIDYFL